MKLNKLIAGLLLGAMTLGLVGPVSADRQAVLSPQNQRGTEASPGWAGYKYVFKNTTSEELICSGSCLLVGIIMSTGANVAYLKLRDTAVADGNGTQGVPFVRFDPASTYKDQQLPGPIRFSNGISAELTSIAAGEEVTILYIQLNR